ncbi:MAG: glycosyltransferase family 4 protein [Balneolaceae bacterium]|nr:glycosyltransferase family 4 protein [Balneolaceae bacterium]
MNTMHNGISKSNIEKPDTLKTLYIISKGMNKFSDLKMKQLEENNEIPRASLLDNAITAELLDERYLREKSPGFRKFLYKFLPVSLSQLIEAIIILKNYDVILSHKEKVGLPLALWMKVFKISKPHIIIISRITSVDEKKSRQKMWFFEKTKDSISKFIIWSSSQRKIAIKELGIPPEKMILVKRGIDQKFWKGQNRQTDMICSVGMEARDYPTLIDALRPLEIPCHIAAGVARGEIFNTIKRLHSVKDLPDFITVGKKKPSELRELYARSRFVVIPLLPSDSDNGLTTILESMAMGKTVICTKTDGQIDVIQDGVTGILVPQGDVKAMQAAIFDLWNDPERCAEMGSRARVYIEETHNIEQFVESIKNEIETTLNGKHWNLNGVSHKKLSKFKA